MTTRDEPPEALADTINGLLSTAGEYLVEVLVIDDGSIEPVQLGRDAIVIRNHHAVGVSQARRQGGSFAKGDVLVWLDAHMRFGHDWMERMLDHVDTGAVLCPASWDYELSQSLYFGADLIWNSVRDHQSQRYPGLGLSHRVEQPAGGAVVIPAVLGACYMMRRDAYQAIGGFCPYFRTWGVDEQDLSSRAWLLGSGAVCVSNAAVGHRARAAFPYPVTFDDLEFNQVVMISSIFERRTVERLRPWFQPLSAQVADWLAEADISGWRALLQSRRQMSDDEFMARFDCGSHLWG